MQIRFEHMDDLPGMYTNKPQEPNTRHKAYSIMRLVNIALLLITHLMVPVTESVATDSLTHLRVGEQEWDTFASKPDGERFTHIFEVGEKEIPKSLSLRQIDVKQQWTVMLNDKQLGRLVRDENDMRIVLDIPTDLLRVGNNELSVTQTGRAVPDDIYIGDVKLHGQVKSKYLNQCAFPVRVCDKSTNKPIPCRLTILDEDGVLMPVGNSSDDTTAVREGVVYTSTGDVSLRLPFGRYQIIAGRGMEWGIDSVWITATPDGMERQKLEIEREVDTRGFVSCDTHVHTFTHSRHGDATLDERLITIAGEGIELPIATDHNLHIDYDPRAKELGVRQFFTPVIGNEVTTRVGHFNIFPVTAGAPLPDHTLEHWDAIVKSIQNTTGAGIVILNHARDVHSGITPFSPMRHNSLTGTSRENGAFVANAMELINSGATQTDVMQLYRDWFGLLNRGFQVTGIGCSDSHDVARHFIGQSRTYIRTPDDDPQNIDVNAAVTALAKGDANLSYGLFVTMSVDTGVGGSDHGNGPAKVLANIQVQGPSWVTARHVELYVNGSLYKTVPIRNGSRAGVKWTGRIRLNDLKHDAFLVAIARGDGVSSLHWPTAKPYQPTSIHFEPYTLGSTGAIRLDIDRDGKYSSAREYAEQLMSLYSTVDKLIPSLAKYESIVSSHVAELLDMSSVDFEDPQIQQLFSESPSQVRRGFFLYQRSKIEALMDME